MSKITKFANGQTCTLMWSECLYDMEGAVVCCHLPHPDKGMGNKAPDEWSIHACTSCHRILDGADRHKPDGWLKDVLRALAITQKRLKVAGLLVVKE